MLRQLVLATAPLALICVPAMAADAAYYGPLTWADGTFAAGVFSTTNPFGTQNGSAFLGEGRFGTRVGNGMAIQLDVSGSNLVRGSSTRRNKFDIAGHLLTGMYGGTFGVMGSLGSGDQTDRWVTLAGEGAIGLGALAATLVVQGGWSTSLTDSDTSAYLHGVVNVPLSAVVMLSGNLGFASTNDHGGSGSESYTRYGAQATMAFNPSWSGFVAWQGEQKSEPGYSRTDSRFLGGLTIRVNEGPLGTVSPFHNFNLETGIIGELKN
jgi:hypothetical protein